MWVHFTARVVRVDVDLRLVDEPDDLHVIRRLHELNATQRARWNDARAASWLGAPRDHLTLCVSHDRVRIDRRPQAEVCTRAGENKIKLAPGVEERDVPSTELMKDVWQSEVGPDVVELQIL